MVVASFTASSAILASSKWIGADLTQSGAPAGQKVLSVHVGNRRTKRQDFITEFEVWLNLRSGKRI